MPDGLTHYKYYLKGYKYAIPISIAASLVGVLAGAGYLVGYTLGRWCDPDWDVQGVNAGEGRMVNEIPVLGHLLYGLSSSYGSVFRKYHRSWITHFPVVSTAIRLIWVLIIPFGYLDAHGVNFIGNGWHIFWLGLWAGLSHADGIHWYLDNWMEDYE